MLSHRAGNAGPFVALSSFLMPTHQSPCGCPTRRLTGTVRTRTEYQPQHHHRTYNTYREGGRVLSSRMPCSMSATLVWLPSALKGSEPKMFSLISPNVGYPPDLGLAYARAARSCQPPFSAHPQPSMAIPGSPQTLHAPRHRLSTVCGVEAVVTLGPSLR